MARRRMIDPNFWASQDVRKLTYRQRLLAIGLFSIADDEGRGIAHPAYIRSQVFPYDDISVQEVADDLAVIGKYLSIKFYEVGEDKYYAWLNWGKWQRVDKPQKSIIPEPPGQSSGAGQGLFRNDSGASQESVQNHSGMSTESGENQSGSILSERKGREGKGREGGREEKVSRESVKNDSGMNLDGMILDAPATARPSLIQKRGCHT